MKDVLGGFKHIDGLVSLEGCTYWQTVRFLRRQKFDAAFDFQGLIKSGFLTLLSASRIRIGFDRKSCREPLNVIFTNLHVNPGGSRVHVIEKNMSLLGVLGIRMDEVAFDLKVSGEDTASITAQLKTAHVEDGELLIGINPGAGWATKRWSPERFSEVGRRLVDRYGCKIIVTWGPGEESFALEIAHNIGRDAILPPPTGIGELTALIRRLSLLISGDTGPLHLAVALGVPTVSIFGPSDPRRNGPYGKGHKVLWEQLECSGCYRRKCKDVRCMDAIRVDEVVAAARNLLDSP
jgi:ADP-heptose:LPS heptosyltransferase